MGIFLIEAELCQVHTHFEPLSVNKLHKLLTETDYDIEHKTIKIINKLCHYCQIKGKALQQFKFTLKKDIDFNYKIMMNIMYLDKKPVLHVVNAFIAF